MPAGAQGCIFSTNGLHNGAGRGNMAQAMLNSPPVTNQGTFVQTSSCTYEDCGMGLREVHKR
eukprot:10888015-Ditylum_brightwellii.AAC.1